MSQLYHYLIKLFVFLPVLNNFQLRYQTGLFPIILQNPV
jgi:hypothetical protein